MVFGNLFCTGRVHSEELRVHQIFIQKFSDKVDLIIYMIGLCDMFYVAVFIQVVVIAYAPGITGCDVFYGVYRAAPVFGS